MKDCREKLLRDLEVLIKTIDTTDAFMVTNSIVKTLSNYEIMERCTEVVPVDNLNEKLIKRYSACLTLDGKSEKTIYQYVRACRKLLDVIEKPFTEMGTYDIRFHLALEKERGVSNVSLENTRAYLSTFFQWMTDEELIPKNPVLKINTIKCPEEVKLPFSDVEIDALRGACVTKKERAIVELLLSSGVRVSELTNMKVKDIDFQALKVLVVEGKGGNGRKTYTTAVSAKHIQDYLTDRKENGEYIFYNKDHKPLNAGGVRYILNVLAERAGVENVHPHRFRRTFATNLAKRGMDIQDIQILLGHKNIETTLTYVYSESKKVEASYKKYIG